MNTQTSYVLNRPNIIINPLLQRSKHMLLMLLYINLILIIPLWLEFYVSNFLPQ